MPSSAKNLLDEKFIQFHTHLIPRRKGDVENPRGGVRHLISGKVFYEVNE
jgi:diadenosine tetraphosphate (Ap4A) HIT family hydrolase